MGEEFLGEAGVGEDLDRVGAAVLDRAGVAELLERFGDVGQGRVEPVDPGGSGFDVDGFVAVAVAAADVDAAVVGGRRGFVGCG
ncbi:hypothetical protein, partial [Kribbella sindirgiensis]|uniref:hypothetical protein n=1 Tax=Kribbella sindirgiensis TaxID=1124744 RepID=UPI001EDFFFE9